MALPYKSHSENEIFPLFFFTHGHGTDKYLPIMTKKWSTKTVNLITLGAGLLFLGLWEDKRRGLK